MIDPHQVAHSYPPRVYSGKPIKLKRHQPFIHPSSQPGLFSLTQAQFRQGVSEDECPVPDPEKLFNGFTDSVLVITV